MADARESTIEEQEEKDQGRLGEVDQIEKDKTVHTFLDRVTIRYAKFIVKYPYVNIIIILLLFIWTGIIGFIPQLGAQKLPDFTKPTKGFESRNTALSNSQIAFNNLKRLYDAKGLVNAPEMRTSHLPKKRRSIREHSCYYSNDVLYDVSANKIIYEEKSGGNLLEASKLKDLCKLHASVMEASPNYKQNVRIDYKRFACTAHSIPNYVALLANRSSCFQISNDDVTNFKTVLRTCISFYKDGSLVKCSNSASACTPLPLNCRENARIIYNSFHFLCDASFADQPDLFLKLTLISERLVDPYKNNLYKSVYDSKLKDLSLRNEGNVKVAAFDFYDLKFSIFEEKLFLEGALLSAAVLMVFILIMLYSGSVFIGLTTFLCIVFAAVLAYFWYGIIFRLSFFPFLNVLTIIFLVGIGADDAFVYMGTWKEAKISMPYQRGTSFDKSLVEWTAYSLKHASSAMFVTSFTTAAAFYAGASSKIISIRCFGIYAGTSIIMNYLMMVIWFPVSVIISEKQLSLCLFKISPATFPYPSTDSHEAGDHKTSISKAKEFIARISQRVFGQILPRVVIKLRYVWLFIFTLLGLGGILVLFVSPKLRLPITKEFQMFSESSSIEQFSLHYKSKFNVVSYAMPIYFVFGVDNSNTASTTTPDDAGYLRYQKKFTITSAAEQLWLKAFCEKLQNASFVSKASKESGSCNGIISMFKALTMPCNSSNHPRCCQRNLPLPQKDASFCIHLFFNSTKVSASFDGLLFDLENRVRAIVIKVISTSKFSEAYDTANAFYTGTESWFQSVKESAPDSFRSGFWHSFLDFYDLQKSLASGTQVSLGISVAIAFCVVLLTTWNVLISIYTVISIIFVISVSIGSLVLAGWRLNIMESMIFSVAAGLAVDFTLHYGVAYRTAADKSCRKSRVIYSFAHIASAVTMGAITTFISGLVMAPASVLVYIQLSHFLMVLMAFSWLYATFFFMSLCSAVGPTNDFFQVPICKLFSSKSKASILQPKNVSLEEQEMQTISNANI